MSAESMVSTVDVIGTPRDRVDGRLKVVGAKTYPIDAKRIEMAHTLLVDENL